MLWMMIFLSHEFCMLILDNDKPARVSSLAVGEKNKCKTVSSWPWLHVSCGDVLSDSKDIRPPTNYIRTSQTGKERNSFNQPSYTNEWSHITINIPVTFEDFHIHKIFEWNSKSHEQFQSLRILWFCLFNDVRWQLLKALPPQITPLTTAATARERTQGTTGPLDQWRQIMTTKTTNAALSTRRSWDRRTSAWLWASTRRRTATRWRWTACLRRRGGARRTAGSLGRLAKNNRWEEDILLSFSHSWQVLPLRMPNPWFLTERDRK